MSSEAILEHPPLYANAGTAAARGRGTGPERLRLAREYLDLCREFPPHEGGGGTRLQCIKMHLQVFFHAEWKRNPRLYDSLFPVRRRNFELLVESHASESELAYFYHVLDQVAAIQSPENVVEDERLTWYMRHRTHEEAAEE